MVVADRAQAAEPLDDGLHGDPHGEHPVREYAVESDNLRDVIAVVDRIEVPGCARIANERVAGELVGLLGDDIAESVGLDGLLAHGMLTIGSAVQPVFEWLGTGGTVIDYQVRFTRPVPVGPSTASSVTVIAKVGLVDDDGARIDLTVTFDGATVLGKAQVRVSLAAA